MTKSMFAACTRIVVLVLAASCLHAADKNSGGVGCVENYNIPLWDEGKVPLAHGNGPLDSPFLTVFTPPENKRNGTAAADRGAADGSAQVFLDLNRAGAVAELHIYQKGRHGFEGTFTSPEFSPRMSALHHFLKQGGFMPEAK